MWDHQLRGLGHLRRIHGLLRHDGDAVEERDELHVWKWDVQCEHQHGLAVVYAEHHELRWEQLRGVEHVQLRQCVLDDGDAVEDGDELQPQLRDGTVWGVHQHGDAVVCAVTSTALCSHQLRGLEQLRRIQ